MLFFHSGAMILFEIPDLKYFSKITFPMKQILTSKAAWAYWNERFVAAWSEAFLSYSLPLYIKG